MEFEFRRNRLDGTVFAEFSMEHTVIGPLFAQEFGDNTDVIQILLAQVLLLKTGAKSHYFQTGADISVDMDSEHVRVFVNAIDFDEEMEFDEDMSLYDAESEAFCGLEDFETALQSWLKFLQEK
jgi:uncharacterized protein YacL (UPF0231 family)